LGNDNVEFRTYEVRESEWIERVASSASIKPNQRKGTNLSSPKNLDMEMKPKVLEDGANQEPPMDDLDKEWKALMDKSTLLKRSGLSLYTHRTINIQVKLRNTATQESTLIACTTDYRSQSPNARVLSHMKRHFIRPSTEICSLMTHHAQHAHNTHTYPHDNGTGTLTAPQMWGWMVLR
jgi:hypothetical protein